MTTIRNIIWTVAALSVAAAPGNAQTAVNFTGGQLSLRTTSASQQLKVEVQGATARLFGFSGVPDGSPYSGVTGISLHTGAGNDDVEFLVQTAQSLSVEVNTGSGSSTTVIKWKTLAGTTSPVAAIDITSGTSGRRFVHVEVESEAPNAVVNLNAGAADDIAAKVTSSNITNTLRVAFSASAPKTQFEVSSNASLLTADVRGTGTPLPDEMKFSITQSRPAVVDLTWNIESGAASDLIEANVSASGSSVTQRGSVLGHGGDDQILFETDAFTTVTGLTLAGGAGNDKLHQIIKGRFQSSQTLQTVMTGGDGNDILLLSTDTGIFGTGLPGDTFPLLNCGPGTDQYQGFGLIRFCEIRL